MANYNLHIIWLKNPSFFFHVVFWVVPKEGNFVIFSVGCYNWFAAKSKFVKEFLRPAAYSGWWPLDSFSLFDATQIKKNICHGNGKSENCSCNVLPSYCKSPYNPPKTNLAPENGPSQKECTLPTTNVQGLCLFQGVSSYCKYRMRTLLMWILNTLPFTYQRNATLARCS